MEHPLDRPFWSAITTRQRHFALGDGRAARFVPEIGWFAAAADAAPENLAALAALVPAAGMLGLVETDPPPLPPGLKIVKQAACVQMVAERPAVPAPGFAFEALGDRDAADMLALATLTEPGPFFARTHQLGAFIGIREEGQLVAMAGERLKPPGYTEVSGVCTRPGFRGRGYAAGLMAAVSDRIAARGETPFLHAYADHAATIALYQRLGFRVRTTLLYTLIARA
ncbi:MAG TPA: GNAT family N-acetyltransferase [Sphingomonas sp.]|nr:GNAT family N-acetyltransferase [Sphingomonas sp.]